MLTLTLRRLERDGLITRTVHPTVPPQVEYELTGIGRSLHVQVRALAGQRSVRRAAAGPRRARARPSISAFLHAARCGDVRVAVSAGG
jgi:DNA-binding HxlR family transcriptional regulator